MSWTDKMAVNTFRQLQYDFNIHTLVETGTYKGVNAKLQAYNFKIIHTCEIDSKNYVESQKRLLGFSNVFVYNQNSIEFLATFIHRWTDICMPLIYLDAHFYDASLPIDKRFVVKDELRALEGFRNCIIVIHDYNAGSGLGHITYDGIPLGWNVVGELLNKVNPDFCYYTNHRDGCDIVTKEEVEKERILGLSPDSETLDNLNYVWSSPKKTYRGLLYCIPKTLDLAKYPALMESRVEF